MLQWKIEPSVIVGLAVWTGGYLLTIGPFRRRYEWGSVVRRSQQLAFHLGTVCVLVALTGPLDRLADTSLFSAHMAQHMLLTFIAPPLWLMGTPRWLYERLSERPALDRAAQPLLAFAIFNGVMWVWHVPALYDAALAYLPLHILEHLTFLAAATIGWAIVLRPDRSGSATTLKLLYLIPSLFACTALAALITLSPIQLYPFYGTAAAQWALTPLVDQQIGGLVMWLTGDVIYLAAIVWAVKTLLEQTELEPQVPL